MNPAVIFRGRYEKNLIRKSVATIHRSCGNPTVLVATIDPEIRDGLGELLETSGVNAIWVNSVEDVKIVSAREKIAACLCSFWLQDGTYRQVVRHLRRERLAIPVIILSAPYCPHEYGQYLAAMNIGALDYLCYPYQQSDLLRMLGTAIGGELQPALAAVPEPSFQERGAA